MAGSNHKRKAISIESSQQIINEMVTSYPAKVSKNRVKHAVVTDKKAGHQKIEADTKTIPGIFSNRGCAYAGCKGVVYGPIKNMVHITHGPIGCGYYSWGTRRNFGSTVEGVDNFVKTCFSTDMQESDIVFGGEKKLYASIIDAYNLYKPSAIGVYATCPVGLIGDDIISVCKRAEKEIGVPVIPNNCEGYRGVSQSAGHHIASNTLMNRVIGQKELEDPTPFDINIFGEYNIGGDAWAIKPILEKIGYRVVSTFTGDATFEELQTAHKAKLNILMCHRSINYANRMMEDKWGLPWLKVNYIGIDGTVKSLRDLAKFFDDPEINRKTEEVIAEELALVEPAIKRYRERLKGKRVLFFSGGSRSDHYINLFETLGMDVVVNGYQFAHRDDYEGSEVYDDITKTAAQAMVEDLHFAREEGAPILREDAHIQELQKEIPLLQYEGLMKNMREGTITIDDLNHFETEFLIDKMGIDLFCSGIKDKYYAQKLGVPSRQMHSYDYSGPYAGFEGSVIFAADMDMAVNSPTWKLIKAPWQQNNES